MSQRREKLNESGFTLVELLVVVAILGLVTVAMFSVFESTRNTAGTQDEVVDLQQNLRVAMDTLTKDIQMAGFLVPPAFTAIGNAPKKLSEGDLTIRTATATVDVARLDDVVTISGPINDFILANTEMARLFEAGDEVRLIRSPDHGQKIDSRFNVVSVTIDTVPDPDVATIKLSGFAGVTTYQEVDLLVKTRSTNHPAVITYDLVNNQLRREVNDTSGAQVVADDITDVEFMYRLEDGTETDTPAAIEDIRGVRVTLTGAALDFETKGTKTRLLTKLITLKNDL